MSDKAENAELIDRKPESIAALRLHEAGLNHLTRWNHSATNWHEGCETYSHRVRGKWSTPI
jgi:hypothetical protein